MKKEKKTHHGYIPTSIIKDWLGNLDFNLYLAYQPRAPTHSSTCLPLKVWHEGRPSGKPEFSSMTGYNKHPHGVSEGPVGILTFYPPIPQQNVWAGSSLQRVRTFGTIWQVIWTPPVLYEWRPQKQDIPPVPIRVISTGASWRVLISTPILGVMRCPLPISSSSLQDVNRGHVGS